MCIRNARMHYIQKAKTRKGLIGLKVSERIDAAVQFHKDFPEISLNEVADIYECDRSSISKRLRGVTKSRTIEAQSRQHLSPQEEEILVKWILQYHLWGLPLRIYHLKQFAFEIMLRKAHSGDSLPFIGKNWHCGFLKRHPTIKTKLSQPIDRNRMAACTPANIKSFYKLLQEITTQHNIKPKNLYNMDEKGFMMGKLHRDWILVPKEAKVAYIRQDGKREWVSTIETISAEGISLDSLIIIAGKYGKEDWFNEEHPPAIVMSNKGWTSNEIGLIWLKQHFEPQTRSSTAEDRLLIVDSHDLHYSIEFIEFCDTHRIHLLILPPHTTHKLQPLDKAIFGPLGRAYHQELEYHNRWNGLWMDSSTFLRYYSTARKAAITKENILSAFRATGIFPFNSNHVLNSLRPNTPPLRVNFACKNGQTVTIDLNDHNPQTSTQITAIIEKYVKNTPGKEIMTIYESLLASNAVLFKANRELVTNARKTKKLSRKLNTEARYLTKEVAQQLRDEADAKEDAKRDAAIAREAKKADQAMRKAQVIVERIERRQQQVIARELRSEWDRLIKIKKSCFL